MGPDGAIIEDLTTGLHWMRCSQGQRWNGVACVGAASKLTWEEAMRQPQGLSFGGYADWRVPTKDELLTLVYCSGGQPKTWNATGNACRGDYESATIDQVAFPKTPDSWCWSSSPDAKYSYGAWRMNFGNGRVNSNENGNRLYVRLVRGKQ
nr:DUF1566 domain-containing protein [Thiocapsa imhoffii]